tara:strand:- start:3382 stop:3612 length:231 start_codon:yes stop_codon:yes gene_type:complete
MEYTKKTNPTPPGKNSGQVGDSALWDGPLSQIGRPHGKGSSSGINGMQISKYSCGCEYDLKPITECAKKGRYNESY